MAMTLIEHAKTEQNVLKVGVIETFAKTSPVLELMPFETIEGGAFEYNQEETLPGIAFRGVNEAWSEGVGVLNPQIEKLKIMGGDADSDLFFKRTGRSNRRATDTEMKIKAAALYFTKIFFDGDQASLPREIDGLNQRLSGDQVIYGGTDGGALSENLIQQAIDAVDGEVTALFMGKKFRRQLFNLYKGSTIISEMQGAFGRTVKTYDDIPIYIIEKDNSDNVILAFDETRGTSDVTASCYCLKFGEPYLAGIQSGPIDARDLGEVDDKEVERTRVSWDIGITLQHPRAASRLAGITATVS